MRWYELVDVMVWNEEIDVGRLYVRTLTTVAGEYEITLWFPKNRGYVKHIARYDSRCGLIYPTQSDDVCWICCDTGSGLTLNNRWADESDIQLFLDQMVIHPDTFQASLPFDDWAMSGLLPEEVERIQRVWDKCQMTDMSKT